MEYVAQLPKPRKMVAPLVALVIGAAGAVGAYALIDDSNAGVESTRVIVTESPAPSSGGVTAKDEARTGGCHRRLEGAGHERRHGRGEDRRGNRRRIHVAAAHARAGAADRSPRSEGVPLGDCVPGRARRLGSPRTAPLILRSPRPPRLPPRAAPHPALTRAARAAHARAPAAAKIAATRKAAL